MVVVLLHERPEGETVIQACESWSDGVESFWNVVKRHYGDSPKSIWEIVEREDDGVLAALGVAGDVVVLSAHGLMLNADGCYMVMPKDENPWRIVRRRQPEDAKNS